MSFHPKKKKDSKSSKPKDELAAEVAIVTAKVSGELSTIVDKHVATKTKVITIQLRQAHEQLASLKVRRANEVAVLTADKKTAQAKLGQVNQLLATVTKERDALIKRLKGRE